MRAGHPSFAARSQSSIALCADGATSSWALINASPDILQQIRAFSALQPGRALRDTGIATVLLMDAQIDHCTGLFMLREHRKPLEIWCHALVRQDLTGGNPVFNVLAHYCGVSWHDMPLAADGFASTGFEMDGFGGLRFAALPLTSNAPPYSPRRNRPEPGDNVGLAVTDAVSGKRLFYAPGLGRMEPPIWSAMLAADCVLVDGTLWSDDEMIALGASKKSSRDMGHLPLSGADGMLEWLDKLPGATRKVLIHINNTNPILDEASPQRAELERRGIEVAFDGMEILL